MQRTVRVLRVRLGHAVLTSCNPALPVPLSSPVSPYSAVKVRLFTLLQQHLELIEASQKVPILLQEQTHHPY